MKNDMRLLITLEELGLFVFGLYLFGTLEQPLWLFLVLLLTPDLSALGYLINTKVGAWTYNFVHHRAVALFVYVLGLSAGDPTLLLAGVILFTHSSMDRVFGYGLKHEDDFKHTHLGWLGKTGG